MSEDWGLLAVKRAWVPEWFWHFLCALSLNHVWPIHRWLCTNPPSPVAGEAKD